MKLRLCLLAVPVLTVGVLLEHTALAQHARGPGDPLQHDWENPWMRISRISADPGAAIPGSDADRVVIYLTADPDGRMPPAEAIWQPAGTIDVQNRGVARLEAIMIELKDVPPGIVVGTPPEALSVPRGAVVRHLIDNPRVLVTKHRYAPATFVSPLHFHATDILVVFLRGGHTRPAAAAWGTHRVRRGEVDLIPAHTFHRFGNAGGDPIEFLMISPR